LKRQYADLEQQHELRYERIRRELTDELRETQAELSRLKLSSNQNQYAEQEIQT